MPTPKDEDRFGRKILTAVLSAFWLTRRFLTRAKVARALASPTPDITVPEVVGAAWATAAAPLQRTLTQTFVEAVAAGGGAALDAFSDPVVTWARTQSATLVREITAQQLVAIRQILGRAASGEFNYRVAAEELTKVVGLTARQEAAVAAYRARLVAQAGSLRALRGLTPDRVQALTDRYRDRVIRQRATVIARTEALTALNHGQYVLWQQSALGQDPTMVKMWIIAADERTCASCQDLDGETRPLDAPFAVRGRLVQHPPAHPQCRCTLTLVRARQRLVA